MPLFKDPENSVTLHFTMNNRRFAERTWVSVPAANDFVELDGQLYKVKWRTYADRQDGIFSGSEFQKVLLEVEAVQKQ